MKLLLGLVLAIAGLAWSAIGSSAQERVGQATLIRTSVSGGGGALAVRSPVYRDERINTSRNGLGEFRFEDGTKFAVGGSSSVVIDRFVYAGKKTFDELTVSAARGSFRWISGKSKHDAYEIQTPAGTIGIRGTRLDVYVGPGGLTAVVLLSGRARFCGSNGCQELRRTCDVVVATPGGGVSQPTRVNQSIFQTVGSDRAFPFLSGRQALSSGFNGALGGSCGLSGNPGKRAQNGGTPQSQRSASAARSAPDSPDPDPDPNPDPDPGPNQGEGCEGGGGSNRGSAR